MTTAGDPRRPRRDAHDARLRAGNADGLAAACAARHDGRGLLDGQRASVVEGRRDGGDLGAEVVARLREGRDGQRVCLGVGRRARERLGVVNWCSSGGDVRVGAEVARAVLAGPAGGARVVGVLDACCCDADESLACHCARWADGGLLDVVVGAWRRVVVAVALETGEGALHEGSLAEAVEEEPDEAEEHEGNFVNGVLACVLDGVSEEGTRVSILPTTPAMAPVFEPDFDEVPAVLDSRVAAPEDVVVVGDDAVLESVTRTSPPLVLVASAPSTVEVADASSPDLVLDPAVESEPADVDVSEVVAAAAATLVDVVDSLDLVVEVDLDVFSVVVSAATVFVVSVLVVALVVVVFSAVVDVLLVVLVVLSSSSSSSSSSPPPEESLWP